MLLREKFVSFEIKVEGNERVDRSQRRTKGRDFQRNEPAYRKPREAKALLIWALLHFTRLAEEIEGGRAKLTRWSVNMWYIDDNFDKCRQLELWSERWTRATPIIYKVDSFVSSELGAKEVNWVLRCMALAVKRVKSIYDPWQVSLNALKTMDIARRNAGKNFLPACPDRLQGLIAIISNETIFIAFVRIMCQRT